MNHKKMIVAGFLCLVIFFGCGLKETVVQKEKISYLSFSGNIENAVVFVDDLEPISLKSDKREPVHYEVSAGKHHIVVTKNGSEVVNRIVLIGSGSVKEIKVP